MIVKNGFTYWIPAASHDNVTINSYHKWQLAFRVFSDIFCRAFPDRSAELLQYNHVIQTISAQYV